MSFALDPRSGADVRLSPPSARRSSGARRSTSPPRRWCPRIWAPRSACSGSVRTMTFRPVAPSLIELSAPTLVDHSSLDLSPGGGGRVIVGVPKEVKDDEYRVAITPAGVRELTSAGHTVFVEEGAGVGSSIPDADFVATGAKHRGRPRRGLGRVGPDPRGEGAGRRGVPAARPARRTRSSSPTSTWPRRRPAPRRCWPRATPPSPTRRSACPTTRSPCSPR